MKNKDFTISLPDDAQDPDALYKQWSLFSPLLWDGYVVEDTDLPVGAQAVAVKAVEAFKCECGAHTTYGSDCPKQYHSSWCKLYA